MTPFPRLPSDFRFGAGTAAFQIEGAAREGGRGESIWDRFGATSGRIANGDTGDVACDHYHRWRDDLDLIAALGLESYRFSIAWPRIQPNGHGEANPAGIDFYRRLAEGLLERGIEPLATLYHWDLPQALQDAGGWGSRETAERFAEYAAIAAERLGDVISSWTTINEPWVVAFAGHAHGYKAPGLSDWPTAIRAAHHVGLAHGLGLRALRAAGAATVGVALDLKPVEPAGDSDRDREAARRADGYLNRWFLDSVLRGRYPADTLALFERRLGGLELIADGDLDAIGGPIDFLGVNYYRPERFASSADGGPVEAAQAPAAPPTTDMGWEVRPAALGRLLARLRDEYDNPPVYITENGACYEDPPVNEGAVADPERRDYLHAHLTAIGEAIVDGADVRRYYVWSLLDNFEWEHGYAKRFGIVHVDWETQRRTPKASGLWYRDLIGRLRSGDVGLGPGSGRASTGATGAATDSEEAE